MRWRDIRFEKPTEADADKRGYILMLHDDNSFGVFSLQNLKYCIAWMPTNELPAFDPIPDPPDPQYRPYNAAELKQTIGKLVDGVVGYTAEITGAWGDFVYCQGQKVSAEALLKDHAWTDGGKCGVEIDQ
jgi:hypothetical protein